MVAPRQYSEIWKLLEEVPDPELPVINLVELGVVRHVEKSDDLVQVTITPTYTGCPAKKLFEDLIVEKLNENGYSNVEITMQLAPAWTTDWLTEETRNKLLSEGVSPPTLNNATVICPQCKSSDTKLTSAFGSTPCMAMYTCNACLEPFNYFKCHR